MLETRRVTLEVILAIGRKAEARDGVVGEMRASEEVKARKSDIRRLI